MDPLTAAVLTAITAYVSSTTGKVLDAARQAALEKAKELFGRLKAKWSGDEAASGDLERFEADPELYETVVAKRLEQQLAEDPELRAELQRLVDDIGPQIKVRQIMKEGDRVLGGEGKMSKGSADITQKIERGKDVTGFILRDD